MRILVLMGGTSSEREVSLNSGRSVAQGLKSKGHEVVEYDLNPDQGRDISDLLEQVTDSIDVVFIALHGGCGEDGTIQALLNLAGVPYTGSGVRSSALCMDKIATKIFFEYHRISTPPWFSVSAHDWDMDGTLGVIQRIGGFPVVVKPADQGSTIGVSIIKGADDLENAIDLARNYSARVVVERYIEGRELSVPILGKQALPIIEIRPKQGFYDYTRKYTRGMTTYHCPAPIDEKVAMRIQSDALKAYTILGCSDFGRVDLRLSNDGEPYFLEVNTIPGMTETSLVPMSAEAVGISFAELVDQIVASAIGRTTAIEPKHGG